jgi:tartrate-resistant acid phosphatase type 5
MMSFRTAFRLIPVLVLASISSTALGQGTSGTGAAASRDSSEELIEALPADLKDKARRVRAAREIAATYTDSTNRAARALASTAEGVAFLLSEAADPAARPSKVKVLLGALRYQQFLAGNPKALQTFATIAARSDDREVVEAARTALRNQLRSEEVIRVRFALDSVRQTGDTAAISAVLDTLQETIIRNDDVSLPRYMRKPPPVFRVKPKKLNSIRVLTLGDFGASRNVETQVQVARSIHKIHAQKKFDLGLTLGDNFYGTGLNDPAHPRWKSQWEDLYGPLKIPVYASLGNHDWGDPSSPAAEIEYTKHSKSWKMPAIYYTYLAGPIQFFVLETDIVESGDVKQLEWLRDEIAKSTAPWKVVYGHFPIRTQVERDSQMMVVSKRGS